MLAGLGVHADVYACWRPPCSGIWSSAHHRYAFRGSRRGLKRSAQASLDAGDRARNC